VPTLLVNQSLESNKQTSKQASKQANKQTTKEPNNQTNNQSIDCFFAMPLQQLRGSFKGSLRNVKSATSDAWPSF
jgi:hypothetical protein